MVRTQTSVGSTPGQWISVCIGEVAVSINKHQELLEMPAAPIFPSDDVTLVILVLGFVRAVAIHPKFIHHTK